MIFEHMFMSKNPECLVYLLYILKNAFGFPIVFSSPGMLFLSTLFRAYETYIPLSGTAFFLNN